MSSSVIIPKSTTAKAGRPKKEKSDAKFDKKKYMREYMRSYQIKNKETQHARRNTSYYVNKHNLSQDFVNKYGINTANVYKCMEDIRKVQKFCPEFLKDIKEFLDEICKKNEESELTGIEVLN